MKRTTVPVAAKQKLVLVGNGMAGYKFCERFVSYRLQKKYELIVFGEEPRPAYDRVNLTRYLTEGASLNLAPASWYREQGIKLTTGQRIERINRVEKWVETSAGTIQHYDKLILATGSDPFIPSIPDINLAGVFPYRSLDDLVAIQQYMQPVSNVTIIGGGILGLEAARAMTMAGKTTTIIERAERLMSRQLDAAGAAILLNQVEQSGVKVYAGKQLVSITRTHDKLQLGFSDGHLFDTDMVLFAAGIIPRDELAIATGLPTGKRGGIIVNNHMQTQDANIFAIGECAEVHGKLWGLAAPAFEMAEVLAARLSGIFKVFRGDLLCAQLKVMETKVASISSEDGSSPGESLILENNAEGVYKRIRFSPDKKRVLEAMLVGDVSAYAVLLQMIRSHSRVPDNPEDLINGSLNKSAGIETMADSMMVCLCETVSKKAIREAIINEGLTTCTQVCKSTRAGTGCETCRPLLEEMLQYYTKAHQRQVP